MRTREAHTLRHMRCNPDSEVRKTLKLDHDAYPVGVAAICVVATQVLPGERELTLSHRRVPSGSKV
jgi:hypothetical protein